MPKTAQKHYASLRINASASILVIFVRCSGFGTRCKKACLFFLNYYSLMLSHRYSSFMTIFSYRYRLLFSDKMRWNFANFIRKERQTMPVTNYYLSVSAVQNPDWYRLVYFTELAKTRQFFMIEEGCKSIFPLVQGRAFSTRPPTPYPTPQHHFAQSFLADISVA